MLNPEKSYTTIAMMSSYPYINLHVDEYANTLSSCPVLLKLVLVIMSKIPSKLISFGIEKVTSEVLLTKLPTNRNESGKPKVRYSASELRLRSSRSQTVIDNWLRNAVTEIRSSKSQEVTLRLPVVLKTLQRLRSTDHRASYFALLSKIQSSKVQWLNNAGKPIDTKGALPVEFYNEVSSMIYRISLNCDAQELQMLSRFLLQLLNEYNQSLELRAVSEFRLSIKFLRNCLIPIAKTGSVSLVNEALKRIPSEQNNVSFLMELAFYHHSSQFTKVVCQLMRLNGRDVKLNQDEIDAFFPLLFSIMQNLVTYGDDRTCARLITSLIGKSGFRMDPHYQAQLVELSEKYSADRVLRALGASGLLLQWKSLQSRMTWGQFITYLSDLNVDLFTESQDLDFLQEKLSEVGPSVSDWNLFLQTNKIPEEANPSIKSFAINTILTHLAADKRLPVVLSVLEHLLFDMGYSQALVDTGKLLSVSRYSGFHCLFKAFSMSNSAIFACQSLFKFLEQNKKIPFKFSTHDFYYMMHSCLNGTDHHPLYYFLFQYIKTMGTSLYDDKNGETSWALPSSIEQLLRQKVAKGRGDDRVLDIMHNVNDWFLSHKSSADNKKIDMAFLRQSFGDEYVPELTVNSMIALERKHADGRTAPLGRHYSPVGDLQASRRVQHMLEFVMENASI